MTSEYLKFGSSLFGTDGVRGLANVYPMTPEIALALGQAVAHLFGGHRDSARSIVIGKDTRLSGYMFEDALAAGMCSMGSNVNQTGPIPTPGLAFLTRDLRCDAGVMISASHNIYQDNGIKFFARDGFKLRDNLEIKMEESIRNRTFESYRVSSEKIGRAKRIEDAAGRYGVFLKEKFPIDMTLRGLRVVLDCANGAAYKVGPTVLSELGADLITLGTRPDGRNINENCGSTDVRALSEAVRSSGADIGIALDGDADRCLLVSEKGDLIDGDEMLSMFAEDMSKRKVLKTPLVVATTMSNLGLEKYLQGLGVSLARTGVGDRYVVEEMRSKGTNLGGEQSGHIIFLDQNTTGDGLLTALQALAITIRSGRTLSELVSKFQRFPQVLVNLDVTERKPFAELGKFSEELRKIEGELAKTGRIIVRYSGTELKARIMIEGEDQATIEKFADSLASLLHVELGSSSVDN